MSPETIQKRSSAKPSAIVIGGGATGCAVARDLSLRGFHVTLIEQGELGTGTSSRFHGMLQSGARYAVSDPDYAAECMRERRIIANLVPGAVEPVGGVFVTLKGESQDFVTKFIAGCRQAQIDCEELDPAALEEPALTHSIEHAFSVPDATINPWRLVESLAHDIRERGGTVLVRHCVTRIGRTPQGSIEVGLESASQSKEIVADAVVNAAGAWSARIAGLAGQPIALELTKGSIIVLAHRVVRRIINRCRYPSSHDIIVPAGTVSLFGTTSEVVQDPDSTVVRPREIQDLLDGAAPLIPGIRTLGFLRAWAGVRPLVKPHDWPAGKPLPRRHQVTHHSAGGFPGLFTICGGSLTTHRSMAEDVCNQVCTYLGWNAACETAGTPLEHEPRQYWMASAPFVRAESRLGGRQNICECESVSREEVGAAIAGGVATLHDLRRRLRIGFGPCQGAFCSPRVADFLARECAGGDPFREIEDFWAERLRGMALTAWGKQAKQILLGEHVHRRLVGLAPVPAHPGESHVP